MLLKISLTCLRPTIDLYLSIIRDLGISNGSVDTASGYFATLCSYQSKGFFAWLLDFNFCETFQPYHLHAFAWHPLTALALYFAGEGFAGVSSIEARSEEKGH